MLYSNYSIICFFFCLFVCLLSLNLAVLGSELVTLSGSFLLPGVTVEDHKASVTLFSPPFSNYRQNKILKKKQNKTHVHYGFCFDSLWMHCSSYCAVFFFEQTLLCYFILVFNVCINFCAVIVCTRSLVVLIPWITYQFYVRKKFNLLLGKN